MNRKKNIISLKEALEQMLKAYGIDSKVKSYSVVVEWAEIVGEKIAKHSTAERMESGKLIVRVHSSAWRQELQFQKLEIIKKINLKYGGEIVKDIIFR